MDREESSVIEISEYDVMLRQSFYHNIGQDPQHEEELMFESDGETYQFEQTLVDDYYKYVIRDESGDELIVYHTKDLFDDIFGDSSETEYKETILESEDATFKIENERATLKITLFSLERTPAYYNGEFDLFIDIK